MHLLHVLAVSVLIAGCWNRDAPGPADPATAEPRREDACHAEAEKLGQWLTILEREGHATLALGNSLELVLLAGAPAKQLRDAPAILVSRTEVMFQGQLIAAIPATQGLGYLTTKLGQALAQVPGSPVILALDKSAPWSVFVGVVQAAQAAGASSFELVFTGASKLPPPPPKSQKLAREADLFGSCAPAITLMDELGRTNRDKGRMLIEELPPAIEACRCQVDLMALRRWLWEISGRSDPGMPVTSVSLAVAPGGTPLTADPTAPWSVAHAAVVAAARDGKPVALK